jgi:hypothetical protein
MSLMPPTRGGDSGRAGGADRVFGFGAKRAEKGQNSAPKLQKRVVRISKFLKPLAYRADLPDHRNMLLSGRNTRQISNAADGKVALLMVCVKREPQHLVFIMQPGTKVT